MQPVKNVECKYVITEEKKQHTQRINTKKTNLRFNAFTYEIIDIAITNL